MCPSCTEKLRYQDVDENAGIGNLSIISRQMRIEILSKLSVNDLLSVSRASKAMNNLCQFPLIWNNIAFKEDIFINSKECLKDQVKKALTLFSDPTQTYRITIKQLQDFKKEWVPGLYHIGFYSFSIRKNKFKMVNQNQIEAQHEDRLSSLNNNNYVAFTFDSTAGGFSATFDISHYASQITDLNDPEYKDLNKKLEMRVFQNGPQEGEYLVGNSFLITKL